MTHENIAPAAAAARENARSSDGRFGAQFRPEADLELAPAPTPGSWSEARIADLAAFRDDPHVRENPAAAAALKRASILATAFRDRPVTEAVQNAVNATVTDHDMPGGLLEGFRAANGNAHVGFLKQIGHRGRVLAVKQPWDSSTIPPVAGEQHAVLAALVEEKLRAEHPDDSVADPEAVRAAIGWEEGDLDAAEAAEVSGRLARRYLEPLDQLNDQGVLAIVDQVREASRGMSLTQLRENRFGAADASSVVAEALGSDAERTTQLQYTAEGDPTGSIIFASPAGNTVEYTGGFARHGGAVHWHEGSARATRLRELPQIVAAIDRGEA